MDYQRKTLEYYSKWIGDEGILFDEEKGIVPVYCKERNEVQYGYGDRFDLYVLMRAGKIIVSYGDSVKERIGEITAALQGCAAAEEVSCALSGVFMKQPEHHIKYVFSGEDGRKTQARALEREEYPLYRDFFVKCNPGCKNIDWLEEYFEEMAAERICCGYIVNGAVVSCTDAPGMPYMQECMQEIGVNTLEAYRGKGYAAQACAACIREIIRNGKCPVWSTHADNIASRKLAERAGFREFAEVLTVTL